jgi:hypothetical protein
VSSVRPRDGDGDSRTGDTGLNTGSIVLWIGKPLSESSGLSAGTVVASSKFERQCQ